MAAHSFLVCFYSFLLSLSLSRGVSRADLFCISLSLSLSFHSFLTVFFIVLLQSHELAEGLKQWVADIQETEKAAEEAAERGLKILEDQVEGLRVCSDNIIDAAKSQALLTLQYGVPYVPNGSDQWRRDLEAGKSDERLKQLTAKMTSQVATVTGVPQTVVDASFESKTGFKTGPSVGDNMSSLFGNGEKKSGEDGGGGDAAAEVSSGEVEMVSIKIKEENEVKVATPPPVDVETSGSEKKDGNDEESEPAPITSEQAALLGQFRAPKQPEEYWYENHLCMFKFLFVMCFLNFVLAIVTILVPF